MVSPSDHPHSITDHDRPAADGSAPSYYTSLAQALHDITQPGQDNPLRKQTGVLIGMTQNGVSTDSLAELNRILSRYERD